MMREGENLRAIISLCPERPDGRRRPDSIRCPCKVTTTRFFYLSDLGTIFFISFLIKMKRSIYQCEPERRKRIAELIEDLGQDDSGSRHDRPGAETTEQDDEDDRANRFY